jgi:phosphotriesterase-related protein
MKRRLFLKGSIGAAVALCADASTAGIGSRGAGKVMTVRGSIDAHDMGFTLPHEHIIANFQPYEEWARAPMPYDEDEVARVVSPYLTRIRDLGCRTFIDPTATFLGRDPHLLRRLSEQTGLHILTVTGNYAADHLRHLPPWVYSESPEAIARRYVAEFRRGIGGTGVRPGLIKLGFDGGALAKVEQSILRAAVLTHLETGLVIGAHTGSQGAGQSAFEQLAILAEMKMDPSAWIWIHAHNEPDSARHVEAGKRGAWVEFDGLREESLDRHVELVTNMRGAGLLDHVLVSQDAGWYHVGQPGGGNIRGYDLVFTRFIPTLRANGFSEQDISTLFVDNPARAFSIRDRSRR